MVAVPSPISVSSPSRIVPCLDVDEGLFSEGAQVSMASQRLPRSLKLWGRATAVRNVVDGIRGPGDFELIERISREALASHPVWTHYEADVDGDRILAWGVSSTSLAGQEQLFKACGLIPLYPVLDLSALDGDEDVMLAARFRTGSGAEFEGYLLEPLAFGLFHEGEEYSFNRSLPDFSAREAQRLAEAAGIAEDALLPLRIELDPRIQKPGDDPPCEITRFW